MTEQSAHRGVPVSPERPRDTDPIHDGGNLSLQPIPTGQECVELLDQVLGGLGNGTRGSRVRRGDQGGFHGVEHMFDHMGWV